MPLYLKPKHRLRTLAPAVAFAAQHPDHVVLAKLTGGASEYYVVETKNAVQFIASLGDERHFCDVLAAGVMCYHLPFDFDLKYNELVGAEAWLKLPHEQRVEELKLFVKDAIDSALRVMTEKPNKLLRALEKEPLCYTVGSLRAFECRRPEKFSLHLHAFIFDGERKLVVFKPEQLVYLSHLVRRELLVLSESSVLFKDVICMKLRKPSGFTRECIMDQVVPKINGLLRLPQQTKPEGSPPMEPCGVWTASDLTQCVSGDTEEQDISEAMVNFPPPRFPTRVGALGAPTEVVYPTLAWADNYSHGRYNPPKSNNNALPEDEQYGLPFDPPHPSLPFFPYAGAGYLNRFSYLRGVAGKLNDEQKKFWINAAKLVTTSEPRSFIDGTTHGSHAAIGFLSPIDAEGGLRKISFQAKYGEIEMVGILARLFERDRSQQLPQQLLLHYVVPPCKFYTLHFSVTLLTDNTVDDFTVRGLLTVLQEAIGDEVGAPRIYANISSKYKQIVFVYPDASCSGSKHIELVRVAKTAALHRRLPLVFADVGRPFPVPFTASLIYNAHDTFGRFLPVQDHRYDTSMDDLGAAMVTDFYGARVDIRDYLLRCKPEPREGSTCFPRAPALPAAGSGQSHSVLVPLLFDSLQSETVATAFAERMYRNAPLTTGKDCVRVQPGIEYACPAGQYHRRDNLSIRVAAANGSENTIVVYCFQCRKAQSLCVGMDGAPIMAEGSHCFSADYLADHGDPPEFDMQNIDADDISHLLDREDGNLPDWATNADAARARLLDQQEKWPAIAPPAVRSEPHVQPPLPLSQSSKRGNNEVLVAPAPASHRGQFITTASDCVVEIDPAWFESVPAAAAEAPLGDVGQGPFGAGDVNEYLQKRLDYFVAPGFRKRPGESANEVVYENHRPMKNRTFCHLGHVGVLFRWSSAGCCEAKCPSCVADEPSKGWRAVLQLGPQLCDKFYEPLETVATENPPPGTKAVDYPLQLHVRHYLQEQGITAYRGPFARISDCSFTWFLTGPCICGEADCGALFESALGVLHFRCCKIGAVGRPHPIKLASRMYLRTGVTDILVVAPGAKIEVTCCPELPPLPQKIMDAAVNRAEVPHVLLLVSPKGTAKSKTVYEGLNDMVQRDPTLAITAISYRTALATTTSAQLAPIGMQSYVDVPKGEPLPRAHSVQLDSLHLRERLEPPVVLYLDESESLAMHCEAKTMQGHRDDVLTELNTVVNGASAVIMTDADGGARSLLLALLPRPDSNVSVIINECQPHVRLAPAVMNVMDVDRVVTGLVEDNEPVFGVIMSKNAMKDYAARLVKNEVLTREQILEVNSEEQYNKLLAAKNDDIFKEKLLVLVNEALAAGRSVMTEMSLTFGVFGPGCGTYMAGLQMLARARKIGLNMYLYCLPEGSKRQVFVGSVDPRVEQHSLESYTGDNRNQLGHGSLMSGAASAGSSVVKKFAPLWARNSLLNKISNANYSYKFQECLLNDGHLITNLARTPGLPSMPIECASEEQSSAFDETSEAVQKERFEKLAAAPLLDWQTYETLSAQRTARGEANFLSAEKHASINKYEHVVQHIGPSLHDNWQHIKRMYVTAGYTGAVAAFLYSPETRQQVFADAALGAETDDANVLQRRLQRTIYSMAGMPFGPASVTGSSLLLVSGSPTCDGIPGARGLVDNQKAATFRLRTTVNLQTNEKLLYTIRALQEKYFGMRANVKFINVDGVRYCYLMPGNFQVTCKVLSWVRASVDHQKLRDDHSGHAGASTFHRFFRDAGYLYAPEALAPQFDTTPVELPMPPHMRGIPQAAIDVHTAAVASAIATTRAKAIKAGEHPLTGFPAYKEYLQALPNVSVDPNAPRHGVELALPLRSLECGPHGVVALGERFVRDNSGRATLRRTLRVGEALFILPPFASKFLTDKGVAAPFDLKIKVIKKRKIYTITKGGETYELPMCAPRARSTQDDSSNADDA